MTVSGRASRFYHGQLARFFIDNISSKYFFFKKYCVSRQLNRFPVEIGANVSGLTQIINLQMPEEFVAIKFLDESAALDKNV